MKLADVRAKAFAMPLNDPAYPRGPYKFYNREFVVITYRTDVDALRKWYRNRWKWSVTRLRTSSSACLTPPASATTLKPVR